MMKSILSGAAAVALGLAASAVIAQVGDPMRNTIMDNGMMANNSVSDHGAMSHGKKHMRGDQVPDAGTTPESTNSSRAY
jgi:hypothetical protein